MRKWVLLAIRRSPYMLFLMACVAVTLALCFNIILLSGDFSVADRTLNIDYLYNNPLADVFATGVIASLTVLAVLCLALPFLNSLRAVIAITLAAVLLAAIQKLVLPFNSPSYTVWSVVLLVVGVGYFLCRGLILTLRRRRLNHYLKQYVPEQLVTHYLNDSAGSLTGQARDLTIMFCDIKRFTGITERLNPELLPGWLNRYFDTVSEIVVRHNGTIDKYIGDSVMAFWGAPAVNESHAHDALTAVYEIIPAVAKLSDELVAEGLPPIAVGIGLSSGNANVGHLGSKDRMTYTVVGDAVNTADRLQRCTGAYELSLVVNDRLTEQVPEFLFRELDTVHVKGRQRFVRIFQPICHQDNALPNTHRRLQMHRKAMQFYRRGMWADAETLFRALGNDTQEHAFYKQYVERIVNIRKAGAAADTSFVVDFTQKIG